MLYALGFIGLFTDRRPDGTVSRRARGRCPCARHLLRHRAFPLHHGRRNGDWRIMGGLHFWWPKITGRMYPEFWGKLAALTTFLGFNLTFFPQFIARLSRHAAALSCLSAGVSNVQRALDCGRLDSRRRLFAAVDLFALVAQARTRCRPNPWRATGLEWQTTSPPPKHNFEETPIVTDKPYAYSAEAERDLHMANA